MQSDAVKIHRSRPESQFVIIPNDTLRDPQLSYLARGVLAEILSHPDDWDTTADAISRRARTERGRGGEGRDTIRGVFAELEAAGYLRRVQGRDAKGHISTDLHVYDVSAGRADDGSPGVGQPGVGANRQNMPSPQVAPTTARPGVYTKNEYEYLNTKTPPTPPRPLWPAAVADAREQEGDLDQDSRPGLGELVDEIRAIRPDWSSSSIRRALDHPDVVERGWERARRAMPAMAGDRTSNHPGRLAHDGPWWNEPPAAHVSVPRPPWCGQCSDELRRQIDVPGGVARCPVCHPLADATSTKSRNGYQPQTISFTSTPTEVEAVRRYQADALTAWEHEQARTAGTHR